MEMHDFDLAEFTKVLDQCEGDVFLVTDEGDRLNLKSTLCRMIGLTMLMEGAKVTHAHIECANKADESKLFRFNLFGETGTR